MTLSDLTVLRVQRVLRVLEDAIVSSTRTSDLTEATLRDIALPVRARR